jgi:predicted GTPase
MLNFSFNENTNRINQLCQKTIDIFSNQTDDEINNLIADFQNFWQKEYQQQAKLSIGFIGQYNAGKSTLIKALTGDNTVKISAEICTDKVTEYAWENVLVLDTPGIYAGNTQHDAITLDKISKCDLLVFVVPNELFNPQGAEFFQTVANEMQRVGQMVLVVNKMSRESGSPEDLLPTIIQVIEPHHHHDFYTCFIDADSYLKSQNPKYIKYQASLRSKSNFDQFSHSLQKLIEKNQLSARLVTPLHRAVDLLDKALVCLNSDDQITRNSLELLRRKKLLIQTSQTRVRNAYRFELNQFEHEIVMFGERIASKIDGHHPEEEIEQEIEKVTQEITQLSDTKCKQLQDILTNELEILHSKLQELENSSLGRTLAEQLEIDLVEGQRIKTPNINYKIGKSIIGEQGGNFLRSLGKLSSKASRNVVYKAGKFIGIKFKPFGAFKAAKFIRGFGPLFAVGGVIFDFAMIAKEENEEKENQRKLLEARKEVREDFRNEAAKMRNEYESNIEETLILYDEELNDIAAQQTELSYFEESKRQILTEINNHRQKIKQEIKRLLK